MLSAFRNDFTEIAKTLEEKYGVAISLGSIRYDNNSFRAELKVIEGQKEDAKRLQFEKDAEYLKYEGFTKDMFGKEFLAKDGKTYKLIRLKPNARKNMCVIQATTGIEYTCDKDFLGITSENALKGFRITETDANGNVISTKTL